jgi:lipopolysaccharide transport system permease protein
VAPDSDHLSVNLVSGIEQHFSAHATPRGFVHHAIRAGTLPRRAWEHAVLFRHFFSRELESRFQGTLLGPAWVLVHPVFLFLVYFAVFGFGLRDTMGHQDLSLFAVYLFSGIVCFHGLTAGTNQAMNAIVGNSNLVKKVAFPCELLPIVSPAVETLVLMIGLSVALVAGWLSGVATPGLSLLALPIFALALLAIGTGLGLLLANLNVFVRDIRQLYGILTTPWLFLSPNFWMPHQLFGPDGGSAMETACMVLNPAYCMLLAARQILGLDAGVLGIHTSLAVNLGVALAWGVGLMAVGYGTFMANKHKYADLV